MVACVPVSAVVYTDLQQAVEVSTCSTCKEEPESELCRMLRVCLPTASALGRLAAQGHAVRAMSAGRVVVGAGKSKRPRMPRKAVMEVVRHAPSPGCASRPRARPPPSPPSTYHPLSSVHAPRRRRRQLPRGSTSY